MPLMNEEIQENVIPGTSFRFSGVRPDLLLNSEYTLVLIAMDTSGSIEPYASDLSSMLSSIVDSCKKSPRAENLLVRLITFDSNVSEVHGFIPLDKITPYDDLQTKGMTALYDAVFSGLKSVVSYGEQLSDQDYMVNAILFICTDGEDNSSSYSPSKIADAVKDIKHQEKIESITTVLVGMGSGLNQYLENFKNEANLSQYIDMGDINPQKLAKLAGFVSKSISSQSQSLGSGTSASVGTITF